MYWFLGEAYEGKKYRGTVDVEVYISSRLVAIECDL